jgi:hypothetical protein
MQSRRNFLRTLIGAAMAPFVPVAALRIPDLGFCPPGEWACAREIIEEMLSKHGLTRDERRALFAEARKS